MKITLINNINQEDYIYQETIKLIIKQLDQYQIINCFYEINNDNEISFS
ncbi:hypothetical protein [Spiroplasma endosymbiont of Polydrusus formosus]